MLPSLFILNTKNISYDALHGIIVLLKYSYGKKLSCIDLNVLYSNLIVLIVQDNSNAILIFHQEMST